MYRERLRRHFQAEYRALFRRRGMERIADIQRVGGYIIGGIVLASLLDLPPRRAAFFAGLVLVGAALPAGRLAERSYQLRYVGGVVDLFLAPAAAATLSDSVTIVVTSTAVVATALWLTFETRAKTTALMAVLGLGCALGVLAQLRSFEPLQAASGTDGWQTIVAIIAFGLTLLFAASSLWWQAQAQLGQSKADLAAVLHSTPVVVGRIDASGVVRYIAGDADDFFAGLLDEGKLPQDMLGAIGPSRVEVELGERTFSVTSTPQPNGDSVFTAYDISQIADANRSLEQLMRSKDELVASISHELRTPLTSVLGFSLELRDRLEFDGENDELVNLLASESEEMASIIEDLLVAARADLGTLAIRSEPVDLGEVARWAEGALTNVAPTIEPGVCDGRCRSDSACVRSCATCSRMHPGTAVTALLLGPGLRTWLPT